MGTTDHECNAFINAQLLHACTVHTLRRIANSPIFRRDHAKDKLLEILSSMCAPDVGPMVLSVHARPKPDARDQA